MLKLIGIIALSLASAAAYGKGAYIGFSAGSTKTNLVDNWPQQDEKDSAWNLFVGMTLGENAFAELSAGSLGSYSASWPGYADRVHSDLSHISAAFGLRMQTGPISPFFKIGMTRWTDDTKATIEMADGAIVSASSTDSGIDPMYGIGAAYQASDRFSILVEFDRHTNVSDGMTLDFGQYGTAEATGEDVDVISVGLTYAI